MGANLILAGHYPQLTALGRTQWLHAIINTLFPPLPPKTELAKECYRLSSPKMLVQSSWFFLEQGVGSLKQGPPNQVLNQTVQTGSNRERGSWLR